MEDCLNANERVFAKFWTSMDLKAIAAVSTCLSRFTRSCLSRIRQDITRGCGHFRVAVEGPLFPEGFLYAPRPVATGYDVCGRDVHVPSLAVAWRGDLGWSLKTLAPLAKGTRICDYTGVVVANRRGRYALTFIEHSRAGWALRTTIDASVRGGVARFINHSCDPNLDVVALRTRLDQVPAIAFLTNKSLPANTHLSFDYDGNSGISSNVRPSTTSCLCGAPNCRRFLPRHLDRFDSSSED